MKETINAYYSDRELDRGQNVCACGDLVFVAHRRDAGVAVSRIALLILCLVLPACLGNAWYVDERFTPEEEGFIQAAALSWQNVGAEPFDFVWRQRVDLNDTGRRVIVRAGERAARNYWTGFSEGKVAQHHKRIGEERIVLVPELFDGTPFQALIAHEFGHSLGVQEHLSDPGALMFDFPGADAPTPADVRALTLSRQP